MPTKLYVGNVSYRATEEDLIRKFSETGNCLSAKIVLDSFTGQSRGFAFVEMETEDDAREAIARPGPSVLGRKPEPHRLVGCGLHAR